MQPRHACQCLCLRSECKKCAIWLLKTATRWSSPGSETPLSLLFSTATSTLALTVLCCAVRVESNSDALCTLRCPTSPVCLSLARCGVCVLTCRRWYTLHFVYQMTMRPSASQLTKPKQHSSSPSSTALVAPLFSAVEGDLPAPRMSKLTPSGGGASQFLLSAFPPPHPLPFALPLPLPLALVVGAGQHLLGSLSDAAVAGGGGS